MMTPLDDFAYLINHVLLGEEPVRPNDVFEIFAQPPLSISDRRRFYTSRWNDRSIRSFHTVVLFPRCSEGVAGSGALREQSRLPSPQD